MIRAKRHTLVKTNMRWLRGMTIITKKVLHEVLEILMKQVELIRDVENMGCARFTRVAWDVAKYDLLHESGSVASRRVSRAFPNHLVREKQRN